VYKIKINIMLLFALSFVLFSSAHCTIKTENLEPLVFQKNKEKPPSPQSLFQEKDMIKAFEKKRIKKKKIKEATIITKILTIHKDKIEKNIEKKEVNEEVYKSGSPKAKSLPIKIPRKKIGNKEKDTSLEKPLCIRIEKKNHKLIWRFAQSYSAKEYSPEKYKKDIKTDSNSFPTKIKQKTTEKTNKKTCNKRPNSVKEQKITPRIQKQKNEEPKIESKIIFAKKKPKISFKKENKKTYVATNTIETIEPVVEDNFEKTRQTLIEKLDISNETITFILNYKKTLITYRACQGIKNSDLAFKRFKKANHYKIDSNKYNHLKLEKTFNQMEYNILSDIVFDINQIKKTLNFIIENKIWLLDKDRKIRNYLTNKENINSLKMIRSLTKKASLLSLINDLFLQTDDEKQIGRFLFKIYEIRTNKKLIKKLKNLKAIKPKSKSPVKQTFIKLVKENSFNLAF